ncbi:Hydrogen dehydrogenase [Desulfurobacterium thermolithotrophum DSM 11699]|uniref:Hydrogen dehydrogenase n=1 Tax=Desulfurobacterium thermolithotrophum (strain DSM 11699 / BSA) TaxID=868864 RepID=F0S3G9_DESTD|nr:Ni/Fe hydrogenase subunit alpha [Desulfurobacterium thermolithotrophum]ADY73391.1 Hydrogen dehydrogenase [Desulfurobacterium thermolithotrophum DSM 11699]
MKREVNINHLTRVEGHGAVNIVFENEKLKEIKLRFTEGPRFFEYITRERLYTEIPKIVSRICGICYVSHRLASISAIENAFEVEITPEIKLLRKLLVVGECLESHALHLYFLALPDYMGYPSTIAMAKDYPNVVKRGFLLKEIGNKIMKLIGGKTIHGENILPGGFKSVPSREQLQKVQEDLYKAIPEIKATISLFDSFDYPKFNKEHPISLCINGDKFALLGDSLGLSDGTLFTKKEYELFIEEKTSTYSTAKYSTIKGKPFLIGPLARINHHINNLRPETKEVISTLKTSFPSYNSLHANVARAIEMLELAFEGIEITEELIASTPFKREVEIKPKAGTGYGVKEAPRGTLYHRYTFDDSGRCISANIITPTAQLQAIIEKDLADLIEFSPDVDDIELRKRAEMLIRAYDP